MRLFLLLLAVGLLCVGLYIVTVVDPPVTQPNLENVTVVRLMPFGGYEWQWEVTIPGGGCYDTGIYWPPEADNAIAEGTAPFFLDYHCATGMYESVDWNGTQRVVIPDGYRGTVKIKPKDDWTRGIKVTLKFMKNGI